MAPKKTRSTTKKEKELEIVVTQLVQRLENISKAKVQETSQERLWVEIKKWAYRQENDTRGSEIKRYYYYEPYESSSHRKLQGYKIYHFKVHHQPISQWEFLLPKPIEILGEVIYKLKGLSNKGEPV